MKKRMKDRPGLLDDAQRLADAGRKGDKLLAHITPEEAALLKARGGAGTVNPRTGLLEFYADPMGDGGSYGYGDGTSDAGRAATESATNDMVGAINSGGVTTPGEQLAMALQNGYQPRSTLERFGDWSNRLGSNLAHHIENNPFATIMDLAAPGLLNLGVRGLTGKTIGEHGAAFGRWVSDYDGTRTKDAMTVAGEVPGVATGAMQTEGSAGTANIDGGRGDSYDPRQMGLLGQGMMANAQQPGQVAQDAVRRAFQVAPKAYNSWDINRFVIPNVQF